VWLRQAVETLEGWPEVQAIVWFNGNGDPTRTWRADSSPEALAAFRRLAAAPHLDASGALAP
jgi:hypothetical protein